MKFVQDTLELEFLDWNELDAYVEELKTEYDVVEAGQTTNAPWDDNIWYTRIRVVRLLKLQEVLLWQ